MPRLTLFPNTKEEGKIYESVLHRWCCQRTTAVTIRCNQRCGLRIWFLTDDILRIRAGLDSDLGRTSLQPDDDCMGVPHRCPDAGLPQERVEPARRLTDGGRL